LNREDRAVWATAFYAGLRRGEIQALRVCDVDLKANLIAVERGWDQKEGVIEPKSRAGRRAVPLLAILRDYLDEHLRRTGRRGEELAFGRAASQAFYAATIDGRAKRAWTAANNRERQTAEEAGREPRLLRPITMHECRHTFASLLIDSGANPKAIHSWATRRFRRPSTCTGTCYPAAATRCGRAWTHICEDMAREAADLVSWMTPFPPRQAGRPGQQSPQRQP
jgi:integrase